MKGQTGIRKDRQMWGYAGGGKEKYKRMKGQTDMKRKKKDEKRERQMEININGMKGRWSERQAYPETDRQLVTKLDEQTDRWRQNRKDRLDWQTCRRTG